jgi:hypothetical protein
MNSKKPKIKIDLIPLVKKNEEQIEYIKQVRELLKEQYKYNDTLSKETVRALKRYTDSSHMNDSTEPEDTHDFSLVKRAFESGPSLFTSLTVYRGMSSHYNSIYSSNGFISTSFIKDSAKVFTEENCCLYRITLTPGAYTVLPLDKLSSTPDEYEILLPPGKLSVQMYDIEANEYYCTYIPDNSVIIPTTECVECNIK